MTCCSLHAPRPAHILERSWTQLAVMPPSTIASSWSPDISMLSQHTSPDHHTPCAFAPSATPQAAAKLETQFNCPFCNGESTVGCTMDWETNMGRLRPFLTVPFLTVPHRSSPFLTVPCMAHAALIGCWQHKETVLNVHARHLPC
jgi:hypothetical protein